MHKASMQESGARSLCAFCLRFLPERRPLSSAGTIMHSPRGDSTLKG